MKAVVLHEYSGPEKLRFEDKPDSLSDWRQFSSGIERGRSHDPFI